MNSVASCCLEFVHGMVKSLLHPNLKLPSGTTQLVILHAFFPPSYESPMQEKLHSLFCSAPRDDVHCSFSAQLLGTMSTTQASGANLLNIYKAGSFSLGYRCHHLVLWHAWNGFTSGYPSPLSSTLAWSFTLHDICFVVGHLHTYSHSLHITFIRFCSLD